ncbi:F-box/LRR-repeat protein 3-like isoform X2 [Olea europaea var. sylvestris]|uniref:F-box/LRR-repeat protein 3-like isoform X2 n=1 Tax=Olea europaea var. sylvestris TaxID=158386 RepID=UPI000C1D3B2C|nr:F-box/LRR-repeat protein 3-like isoform X2 [Olea europaea var. sylvestris]
MMRMLMRRSSKQLRPRNWFLFKQLESGSQNLSVNGITFFSFYFPQIVFLFHLIYTLVKDYCFCNFFSNFLSLTKFHCNLSVLMKKAHKTMQAMKLVNPFASLSEEIKSTILDCLDEDSETKKSFSLVCKSFHSIESHQRKTLKPLYIELISRILTRYPLIHHVDLTYCPRVEDRVLWSISNAYWSTLKSINLSRSRFFTHMGLSSLASKCWGLIELDLSNATELTDAGAAAIAEAKNLEKLWMARCKLVSDIGIGCIAVGCKKLKLICLKWCVRLTDLGVGLIATKCKDIQSLDLSYLLITEKCLVPILQLQYLKELILVECPGIDDVGLGILKESCKSLEVLIFSDGLIKVLNISKCHNMSNVGLFSLINGAERLSHLSLAYGSAVTDDFAKCWYKLSGLKSIKLDGCLVTFSTIKAIGDWCVSLKELSLCKCPGVTDEGVSYIAQRLLQLQKLDITCCHKITCASIDSITNSCSSLTSLRMEACCMVAQEAIVLIGQRCQSLKELDITDNEIDDEESISRCTKLLSLKMGVCPNITDCGLSHVAMSCQKLIELDLYRCISITDDGIAAVANGCPALESINMAHCDKVTDASLLSLSQCLQLKVLEIRGCPCVSSVGLSAVATNCKKLSILDIKKCCNIDDTGMISLARYSQYLKQINLSYCPVTDAGLVALASISRLQNMTILHVTGLTPNGVVAALFAFRGLMKVKLHTSFKASIPQSVHSVMEHRGCVFHWRNKAFQVETDPNGWQIQLPRHDG